MDIENWKKLAQSEDNTNRILALQTATSIADEIQLELYVWHQSESNPFFKVKLYNLLSDEYKKFVPYHNEIDKISPLEEPEYYKFASRFEDPLIVKTIVHMSSSFNFLVAPIKNGDKSYLEYLDNFYWMLFNSYMTVNKGSKPKRDKEYWKEFVEQEIKQKYC